MSFEYYPTCCACGGTIQSEDDHHLHHRWDRAISKRICQATPEELNYAALADPSKHWYVPDDVHTMEELEDFKQDLQIREDFAAQGDEAWLMNHNQ